MRVVFAGGDAKFVERARAAVPGAVFESPKFYGKGAVLYVAYSLDQLHIYERWFPGVCARARSRLDHRPLEPGGAMYLPVTYQSWACVGSLGAALEAASVLRGVATVVCPPYDGSFVRAAQYARCGDRVFPDHASTSAAPDDE